MINHDKTSRRIKRIRSSLKNNLGIPRLTIHRTLRHMWAQIIDDKHGKTLLGSSTKSVKAKGTKTEKAILLGKQIALLALDAKIVKIRFDRGQFKYHGRVKALADAARVGGLKF